MPVDHPAPRNPALFVPAVAARRSDRSPGLLKPGDVARLLGISVVTVRRRIREGALAYVRIAGRLYVRPQDLEAFIARHHVPDR